MPDLGYVLYEIHVNNVRRVDNEMSAKIKEWDQISNDAKNVWRQTAQAFMEQVMRGFN